MSHLLFKMFTKVVLMRAVIMTARQSLNKTLFTLLLLLSANSLALESDKTQPITIQADFAELNESIGTAIYQGNVQLSQGSLLIHSDRIVVFSNSKNKVEKVVHVNLSTL